MARQRRFGMAVKAGDFVVPGVDFVAEGDRLFRAVAGVVSQVPPEIKDEPNDDESDQTTKYQKAFQNHLGDLLCWKMNADSVKNLTVICHRSRVIARKKADADHLMQVIFPQKNRIRYTFWFALTQTKFFLLSALTDR